MALILNQKQDILGPLLVYGATALLMLYASYQLPQWLPGDVITALYADSHVVLSAAQEQALREHLRGAASFPEYIIHFFRLDWGDSLAHHQPVATLILEALPWTLALLLSAHLISTLLGLIIGVEVAWRRHSRLEKTTVGVFTTLNGLPEIAIGVILLMVFSYHLGWLPSAGGATVFADLSGWAWWLDRLHHLALPLTTLVLAYLPGQFLLTRASMVLTLRQPYLLTAHAKGLSAIRIRYVHAARNILLPLVTRLGMRLAFMLTGVLVVETLFAYPGLGSLLFQAIGLRDLPVIQGIVLLSALVVLSIHLALEWLYPYLDPRLRG